MAVVSALAPVDFSAAEMPGASGISGASMEVVVLGSGSSGNAILVRAGDTAVLVDAGLSAQRLKARLAECGLAPAHLAGIILTHEHGDHTGGLKTLQAKTPVPLYANALTAEAIRYAAKAALGPWHLFTTGQVFDVGAFRVRTFSVLHDAADPVGLVLEADSVRLGVLTDLGKATHVVVDALRGVHGLFIEANHDERLLESDTKRPWSIKQRIRSSHGHLSNGAAADLAACIATESLQHLILGHLSEDCNSPDLATAAVASALASTAAAGAGIHCARKDQCSARIILQGARSAVAG